MIFLLCFLILVIVLVPGTVLVPDQNWSQSLVPVPVPLYIYSQPWSRSRYISIPSLGPGPIIYIFPGLVPVPLYIYSQPWFRSRYISIPSLGPGLGPSKVSGSTLQRISWCFIVLIFRKTKKDIVKKILPRKIDWFKFTFHRFNFLETEK